jgi:hypothetical protein
MKAAAIDVYVCIVVSELTNDGTGLPCLVKGNSCERIYDGVPNVYAHKSPGVLPEYISTVITE